MLAAFRLKELEEMIEVSLQCFGGKSGPSRIQAACSDLGDSRAARRVHFVLCSVYQSKNDSTWSQRSGGSLEDLGVVHKGRPLEPCWRRQGMRAGASEFVCPITCCLRAHEVSSED